MMLSLHAAARLSVSEDCRMLKSEGGGVVVIGTHLLVKENGPKKSWVEIKKWTDLLHHHGTDYCLVGCA